MLGLQMLPIGAVSAASSPSQSYAGYVVTASTGNNITGIKASWIVPTLTCTSTNTYSNMSAMIDGLVSPSTDQMSAGTYANCIGGSAVYGAYVIIHPVTAKTVTTMPTVHAGDHIEVKAKWNTVTRGWHVSIKDLQTSMTGKVTTKGTLAQPALNSAAVLIWVKAGSPLSNFGTAGFGSLYTGDTHSVTITAGFADKTVQKSISLGSLGAHTGYTLTQYNMVDASSNPMATTGPLDKHGKSFYITWNAAT